jgi:hypothetical protein
MWLKLILQTLFPILVTWLDGLLTKAQTHADAGNHDLAHTVLSDGIKTLKSGIDAIAADITGAPPSATPGGGQGAPVK